MREQGNGVDNSWVESGQKMDSPVVPPDALFSFVWCHQRDRNSATPPFRGRGVQRDLLSDDVNAKRSFANAQA